MTKIECPHRSVIGEQPVCQVVADLIDRPLAECFTYDQTCASCLSCGIPPQVPNAYTASMAIHAAGKSPDPSFVKTTLARFKSHLNKTPPPVTQCVLRGRETRRVACKPCQAGSLTPVMVSVFSCPRHQECTLHNTGTFPKIQACATCGDRLEKYYELDAKPIPAVVLAAIPRRGSSLS